MTAGPFFRAEGLFIWRQNPRFATDKNDRTMENDAIFERLCDLLAEEKVYLDPGVTFPLLCRWLGADVRAMDRRLREEVGMGGRRLMRTLRRSETGRLFAKYGPKCL